MREPYDVEAVHQRGERILEALQRREAIDRKSFFAGYRAALRVLFGEWAGSEQATEPIKQGKQ